MPAKSKAQFRYMQGVAHGSIPPPSGLSKDDAAEYVAGQSPKGLPEKAAKGKKKAKGKKRFMQARSPKMFGASDEDGDE